MKENFIVRMCADVQMDRPIDLDRMFISPGGFEFRFDSTSKTIAFDFGESELIANGDILSLSMRDLDTTEFPNSKKLGNLLLHKPIAKIPDFYIYTGDYDDDEINVVSVLAISFEVYDKRLDKWFDVDVPQNVIDEYNARLREEVGV